MTFHTDGEVAGVDIMSQLKIRKIDTLLKDLKDGDNALVLVVDDVDVNRQLLTTYLSSVGYRVVVAIDGQDALDKIAISKPDLILLDVMMPKLNGFEVCEQLKGNDETKLIPVIIVTALNEIEDKIKATFVGADDFISKPFNKLELLTRIKSMLRISKFAKQSIEADKRSSLKELQNLSAEIQRLQQRLQQLEEFDRQASKLGGVFISYSHADKNLGAVKKQALQLFKFSLYCRHE